MQPDVAASDACLPRKGLALPVRLSISKISELASLSDSLLKITPPDFAGNSSQGSIENNQRQLQWPYLSKRPTLRITSPRVPAPVAIGISAAVFALAHLTPGEFPQLFVLGSALGLSYAQTRNLLTPITIHALWNSGVILLLTFLQLQGYDIKELLQTT
ncbi:hypothetical protein CerSpe_029460 [Prunus speciosa]